MTPYILIRLDTFERINFTSALEAFKAVDNVSKNGNPFIFFRRDETRKRYEMLDYSIV